MEFQHLGAVERDRLKQLQAMQNEHLSCRWIDGDPRVQHTYCGAETQQGSSYCAEHHARAYCSRPLKPIAIPKNAFGARG
jgi:hypothetical protein